MRGDITWIIRVDTDGRGELEGHTTSGVPVKILSCAGVCTARALELEAAADTPDRALDLLCSAVRWKAADYMRRRDPQGRRSHRATALAYMRVALELVSEYAE